MESEDVLALIVFGLVGAAVFWGGWEVRWLTVKKAFDDTAQDMYYQGYGDGKKACTFDDMIKNLQGKEDTGGDAKSNP